MHVTELPVAISRVSYLLCGCKREHQQRNNCVERDSPCKGYCLDYGHHQGLLDTVEVAHNWQQQAGMGTL